MLRVNDKNKSLITLGFLLLICNISQGETTNPNPSVPIVTESPTPVVSCRQIAPGESVSVNNNEGTSLTGLPQRYSIERSSTNPNIYNYKFSP